MWPPQQRLLCVFVWYCRDVPVHLVAGKHDGVIPASNIQHHYAAMRAAGMDVSYREVRDQCAFSWLHHRAISIFHPVNEWHTIRLMGAPGRN
jgi:hypothetical protein